MPASPCRTYTAPKEKAAWERLNVMEEHLERILAHSGLTAEVNGIGYFIGDDGKMQSAPMLSDGNIEKEQGMHRDDYEGLSADEMAAMANGVSGWINSLPDVDGLTAASYEQTFRWNGFEVIDTGGGCTAWSRQLPSGHYVLITDEGTGHTFRDSSDTAVVGAYDADSQPIGEAWEGPLSQAALAIAMQTRTALRSGLKAMDRPAMLDAALDAAVKSIQDALGVRTGDNAGLFFSGSNDKEIKAILDRYVDFELFEIKQSEDLVSREGGGASQRPTPG